MNLTEEKRETGKQVPLKKLESLIANAIRKVGGTKENDLCKYLPVSTGGYMHHFTMRKMKTEQPEQLSSMIEKFIIKVSTPDVVPPKPRAARGSRKKRDQITLTKNDLERMLSIARLAGDKEMISKLTPKKSLTQVKRELISSIRQNKSDQSLWNSFVELVTATSYDTTTSSEVLSPLSPLTPQGLAAVSTATSLSTNFPNTKYTK